MQRDGSACWTTPSGVIRIATSGQTCAQGATGSSQCMQTVGWVATLTPRSMKSTITMLSPLCVSHSRQAASQARQPMQRDGSMNRVWIAMRPPWRERFSGRLAGASVRRLRLADRVGEHLWCGRGGEVLACAVRGRGQRRVEPLDGRGADLELRDLDRRLDGRVGQLVDRLRVAVVERDEERVG